MTKTKKRFLIFLTTTLILGGLTFTIFKNMSPVELSKESFLNQMEGTIEESNVGADITLIRTVHDTDSITYRYRIDTNYCDYWQLELFHTFDTKLEWVENEGTGVKTTATEYTVQLNGDILAKQVYYDIPMLGITQPEDTTLSDWQANVERTAYTTYKGQITAETNGMFMKCFGTYAILIVILLCIYIYIEYNQRVIQNLTKNSVYNEVDQTK